MKMNKIILMACLGIIMSCKPEQTKKIGDRYNLLTGVDGSWKISKVMITDLTLPVPENRDISDFFLSANPLQIEFDAAANTYVVSDPDVLGNPFGAQGTFAFDAEDYPTAMFLYSSNQDTVNLKLENMVREIDHQMGFTLEKNDCASKYISYTYTFNRQ